MSQRQQVQKLKKPYDVLLYGATGFTGKLTAQYLNTHPDLAVAAGKSVGDPGFLSEGGRTWAIAGRTQAKLDELAGSLTSLPDVVCCELTDAAAVKKMVQSARVVLNCAGPYSVHSGDKLLGECARQGVHYSDLAGEGFWQREMVEAWHATAANTGAKIVLGGGVDSIPSDLAVQLALDALGGVIGGPSDTNTVTLRGVYTEYSGSFSGGTLASGRAMRKALKEGRQTKELEKEPYLLAPEMSGKGADAGTGTASGMPDGFKSKLSAGYGLLMVRTCHALEIQPPLHYKSAPLTLSVPVAVAQLAHAPARQSHS
eukprot:SAG22_NODE_402_length_11035_cov_6.315929_5_plen_314_part_00